MFGRRGSSAQRSPVSQRLVLNSLLPVFLLFFVVSSFGDGHEMMRNVQYCYTCGTPRRGTTDDTYCENAKTFVKDAETIPHYQGTYLLIAGGIINRFGTHEPPNI